MPVRFVQHYTRAMAQAEPDVLFVFGDNMKRTGLGGQAAALRGEPNAVGVPTKWQPANQPSAYFSDLDLSLVKGVIDQAFDKLDAHVARGGTVVWPMDGIGTGLARLPERAPAVFAYIEARLKRLTGLGRA